MSRESLVMLLGLVVLFGPKLGVPEQWREYTLIVTGILLCVIGYSLRRSMFLRTIDRGDGIRSTDSFMERDGSTPKIVTKEERTVAEANE